MSRSSAVLDLVQELAATARRFRRRRPRGGAAEVSLHLDALSGHRDARGQGADIEGEARPRLCTEARLPAAAADVRGRGDRSAGARHAAGARAGRSRAAAGGGPCTDQDRRRPARRFEGGSRDIDADRRAGEAAAAAGRPRRSSARRSAPSASSRSSMRMANGAISERVVWPFALGLFEKVRVLMASVRVAARTLRHFRTDRIGALTVAEARYPRAGGPRSSRTGGPGRGSRPRLIDADRNCQRASPRLIPFTSKGGRPWPLPNLHYPLCRKHRSEHRLLPRKALLEREPTSRRPTSPLVHVRRGHGAWALGAGERAAADHGRRMRAARSPAMVKTPAEIEARLADWTARGSPSRSR